MSPYDENWNLDAAPRHRFRTNIDHLIGDLLLNTLVHVCDRRDARERAADPRSPRA